MGFFSVQPIKRFFSLVEKELRVLFRDKTAMIITYLIPLITISILLLDSSAQIISIDPGSGQSSQDVSSLLKGEIPIIGIIDLDDSDGFIDRDLSAELVAIFEERNASGQCQLYKTSNQSILENKIGIGEINAFIIIPTLFEFNLSIHLPVIIVFVVDSIDVLKFQASQMLVQSVILEFKRDPQNNFNGVFDIEEKNTNLPQKYQIFYASMSLLIPLLLFSIGSLIASQSIVSDIPKDRMVLTPTNKSEMMAAKVLANFLIQLGVILIIIGASFFVQLEIRSTWWEYILICMIIALNSVIIGVAISAVAKTSLSAFQYFIFLLIFQYVAVFFVEEPLILNLLPIDNGVNLITRVVLRGSSLWNSRYIFQNMFIETSIIYIFSFIVFKRQKTMI